MSLGGDFKRTFNARLTTWRFVFWYVVSPAFRAVALFRISEWLISNGYNLLALIVTAHSVKSTACEIRPGARIGSGFRIHHPVGIVIGYGVVIGRNCTVLQGVTIGEKYSGKDDHSYPAIGDNVVIGAGSVILGNILIGDNVIIGANSVVITDVPRNSVVAGAPARVIRVMRDDEVMSVASS